MLLWCYFSVVEVEIIAFYKLKVVISGYCVVVHEEKRKF